MQPPKAWSTTTEPTSYKQIYQFVEHALDKCTTFISELESDYYQDMEGSQGSETPKQYSAKKPLSYNTLINWSRPLNELRNARLLHDIRNGKTMRDLLSDAKTGGLITPVSDESIFLMKRIMDKTSDQLYSKIPTLAGRIADCMHLMEQYFLSFYEIEHIHDVVQRKRNEKVPVSEGTVILKTSATCSPQASKNSILCSFDRINIWRRRTITRNLAVSTFLK